MLRTVHSVERAHYNGRMHGYESQTTLTFLQIPLSQEAATAEKLFITQLLNCAVIGTLVYAHIAGLSRTKVTNWFFNGLYEDFDTAWYSDVGTTLFITLTVQIIVPFINLALGAAWAWGRRRLWAKSQLIQR